MSYRDIHAATDSLQAVLKDVLRLNDDEAGRVTEAFEDLAKALADQEIDRLFNRGDFRS
jgi:hypothetical protein